MNEKKDFFKELARKAQAPVTRDMDNRFWEKADQVMAQEKEREKESGWNWSFLAGPITVAASFLLIFYVQQTVLESPEKSLDIASISEIMENQEMLENMELLGQMDEVEFTEEEWEILLEGEENGSV